MECLPLWKALNIGHQLLLILTNLLCRSSFWGGATYSHLNSLGWIQWCCLTQHTQLVKPFAIMTSLSLILQELEVLWLGTNLTVHRWSLMWTNHIDMTAHTPAFFTKLGTTRIYMECCTAGPSHVSHYGAMLAWWLPIHILTGLMTA